MPLVEVYTEIMPMTATGLIAGYLRLAQVSHNLFKHPNNSTANKFLLYLRTANHNDCINAFLQPDMCSRDRESTDEFMIHWIRFSAQFRHVISGKAIFSFLLARSTKHVTFDLSFWTNFRYFPLKYRDSAIYSFKFNFDIRRRWKHKFIFNETDICVLLFCCDDHMRQGHKQMNGLGRPWAVWLCKALQDSALRLLLLNEWYHFHSYTQDSDNPTDALPNLYVSQGGTISSRTKVHSSSTFVVSTLPKSYLEAKISTSITAWSSRCSSSASLSLPNTWFWRRQQGDRTLD